MLLKVKLGGAQKFVRIPDGSKLSDFLGEGKTCNLIFLFFLFTFTEAVKVSWLFLKLKRLFLSQTIVKGSIRCDMSCPKL